MAMLALASCTSQTENPILADSQLPFGAPEYSKYKSEDFLSAFEEAIADHRREIDSIANNENETPDFENVIVALENSGRKLAKVEGIFYNLLETDATPELKEIEKKVTPLLTEHSAYVTMNKKLWERFLLAFNCPGNEKLPTEEKEMLDKYYLMFTRGGADLDSTKKAQLMDIENRLSLATIEFGDHVLAENNAFKLVITDEKDLSGLPQSSKDAAKEAATAAGEQGWLFTLDKPSLIPFLQYADNRDLRKKMYEGYINRGSQNNENDNRDLITYILNLRLEKAKILGFNNYADYALQDKMARYPEKAYALLKEIWNAALPKAKEEAAELQKMIDAEGGGFKLAAWDWWYYTEKLRHQKYELNENEVRQYLSLENVRNGAFMVANKLFGIEFNQIVGVDLYNPEVETFEVLDKDSSHLALYYVDYFPRATKGGGAWMNNIMEATNVKGENQRPIIVNVANFTRPSGNVPALLNVDEARTLFHEFGHSLQGFLTTAKYPSISGTNVARDYVEFPSQIMEHWAIEPEVMKMYARHYKTGEVIPDSLIQKMQAASTFNTGFETVELVGAAMLDLQLHMQSSYEGFEIMQFEKEVADQIGLIPEIAFRYRAPYFTHIFSGGYEAGYYSYLWSEVLDADGYEAFKEKGIFDQETARKYRENILEKGGGDHAMTLYKKFRGAEPTSEALLRNRGLIK